MDGIQIVHTKKKKTSYGGCESSSPCGGRGDVGVWRSVSEGLTAFELGANPQGG